MAKFKAKGTISIGGKRRRKSRKGRKGVELSLKGCIVQSGKKKGKLKKGWRFNKRGQCVRARKS